MKLRIDGADYQFPSMDELTMGEARIIKRYSGLTLKQLAMQGEAGDQDVLAAFVHIAFARRAPNMAFEEIEQRVNNVRLVQVDAVPEPGDPEGDALPPASTRTPNAEDSASGGSGPHSKNGSDDLPVTTLASTGTLA